MSIFSVNSYGRDEWIIEALNILWSWSNDPIAEGITAPVLNSLPEILRAGSCPACTILWNRSTCRISGTVLRIEIDAQSRKQKKSQVYIIQ